jgi:hypothetical protein
VGALDWQLEVQVGKLKERQSLAPVLSWPLGTGCSFYTPQFSYGTLCLGPNHPDPVQTPPF